MEKRRLQTLIIWPVVVVVNIKSNKGQKHYWYWYDILVDFLRQNHSTLSPSEQHNNNTTIQNQMYTVVMRFNKTGLCQDMTSTLECTRRVRISSFVSHITCRPFLPLLFHSKDAIITSYSIYYEYSKVCVQVLLYCSTKG